MFGPPVAIFANGETVSSSTIRRFLSPDALIIAADGGADLCHDIRISPHYLVGDFDSVDPEIKKQFGQSQIIERPSQDCTDLEKALQFSLELNPKNITVFSALGQRGDHTLGNLLILQRFEANIPIQIVDNYGSLRLLKPGRHLLQGKKKQIVSFISFGPVKNLRLEGFRYSLTKEELRDDFLGISNVYESETCIISFDAGKIFFYELFTEG
ncbi:MAG TPA: thiamine diphosphokinase [Calditrichaeota bacterium]|nr:thiamine diphosphokinase [Calditrichota bacterium]